jgi:serine/threonine protein kinase
MPSPVQPGQVIRGKYQVERVLGEGGMGVVVAGRHVGLGQRVAIKFLQPAMLQHAEIVERFAREARAASRLESDHVARVTDVDTMEDGTPFMVMEYLEGQDLATVRASGQPLPLHVAAGYVLEACEAFGEAHALGIVHRDIKPANLFLAKRGGGKTRVKVLDFGISKMGGGSESDAAVTRTSSVMGSAHYMSPEQMLTPREVDHRTDIWALGVTLFELTTARLPFPGESVTQVCAMIMSTQPPAPSSVNPALPPGFDAVVMKCLGRHPQERFASVAQLSEALAQFTAPASPSFGRAPMAHGAVQAVTSNPTSDPGLAAQPRTPSGHGADPLAATPRMFALPQEAQRPSWPHGAAPPASHPSHPSQPSPSSPHATVPLQQAPLGGTTPPVSNTNAPVTKKSSIGLVLAGVGALALVAIGATALVVNGRMVDPSGASAAQTVREAAEPVPPAPPATEPAKPEPSAATPQVTPSSDAPAPSTAASVSTPPAKTQRPAVPQRSEPPKSEQPLKKPSANCNPPFTVDAQGVKRAKPECL